MPQDVHKLQELLKGKERKKQQATEDIDDTQEG
jgi:hypothetical protein